MITKKSVYCRKHSKVGIQKRINHYFNLAFIYFTYIYNVYFKLNILTSNYKTLHNISKNISDKTGFTKQENIIPKKVCFKIYIDDIFEKHNSTSFLTITHSFHKYCPKLLKTTISFNSK